MELKQESATAHQHTNIPTYQHKVWLRNFGQIMDNAIFQTTIVIAEFLSEHFENIYTSPTYEINSNRVIGNYAKDKYLRFLSRKSST